LYGSISLSDPNTSPLRLHPIKNVHHQDFLLEDRYIDGWIGFYFTAGEGIHFLAASHEKGM
jgi:hypothetical protein